MNRAEKTREVEVLGELIGQSTSAFLLDFEGLGVARSEELRGKLRECDGRMRVVKNRLARRAFEGGPLGQLDASFIGQTAIAYPQGDDLVGVAKVIRDFGKEHKLASVKAGLVEGQVISPAEFDTLADLPSREELIAKALYLMKYPITGLATVLNGVVRNFVFVLEQIRQQKENE